MTMIRKFLIFILLAPVNTEKTTSWETIGVVGIALFVGVCIWVKLNIIPWRY